jgi:hypothetical protein
VIIVLYSELAQFRKLGISTFRALGKLGPGSSHPVGPVGDVSHQGRQECAVEFFRINLTVGLRRTTRNDRARDSLAVELTPT